jgi:RHS repeat-associated protein
VHRLQAVYRPDGVVEHYRYDAGDNLVEAPGLGEHLPASDAQHAPGIALQPVVLDTGNRLWRANGERFHHDERDHVVARESHEGITYYLRDAADQLRKVVRGEDTIFEAWYDVLGRRTKERTAAGERTFYWDSDRLAAELGPHGALRVYAGRDGIVPIGFVDYASADAEPASGHSYSVHADHQGSVERVYNARGKLVWRCAYAPYGAARVEVGAGFYQPLRMPGHYWDADTQLHYNRFRYYDPALARYLESDPLGIAGGANLCAYTWNPLIEVDVRGLARKCDTTSRGPGPAADKGEGRPVERPPSSKPATAPSTQNALSHDEAKARSASLARDAQQDFARRAQRPRSDPDYISKNKAGPVVVVVVDARTGNATRPHINDCAPPEDLHPTLEARLGKVKSQPAHPSEPGSHAEVHAVNEALHTRTEQGLPDGPEALDDMHMTPTWLRGTPGEGKREDGMVAGQPPERAS